MGLKIAITSTVSWPYVRRGSRITYELAVYLAGQGHEVHYISTKPGNVSRKKMKDGVEVEYHRLIENPLLTICNIQKFDAFTLSCLGSLLKNDYDIVQSTFPMDAFAASIHKSIRGTPFVHYMFDRFYPPYYITKYGKLVFNRCVRTASQIGAISNFISHDLKEKFGIKGIVIPGTVDLEQFTLCKNKDISSPYILSTSSLIEPRKRVALLVKAFELLLDHVPNAVLILSGHTLPEMSRILLESISPKARKSVEILGVGRREDLPELYRNAAICVLPSVNEAFGLVILESLASGTPVVGTRSGGIPEILNDPETGVLFEETDGPDELCKALLKGLELSRDPKTCTKCRQHAEQYSWSNIGPLYEKLYADVLDGRQNIKSGLLRKKKLDRKISSNEVLQAGDASGRFNNTALPSLFDDALDELDIDYDTYYKFDRNKPLCTYILGWLFDNGIREGNVLVAGSFTSPLTMILEKGGFNVKEVGITHSPESRIDLENQMVILNPYDLSDMSRGYDIIICDDILGDVESPGRILRILKDNLKTNGIFLFTTEKKAGGKARSVLATRKNITSYHDENLPAEPNSMEDKKGITCTRGATLQEAENLISDAGLSVDQSNYIIKKRAIEGSLFPAPVFPYFYKNLLYFAQKTFPPLRSHIFIAARKRSVKQPVPDFNNE